MNYPSGELVTLYKLILEDDGLPRVSEVKENSYTISISVPAGGHKDRSMTFTGDVTLVPNDVFYDKYDQRAGYHYYRGKLGKMIKDPYAYKWYEDPYWYDEWYDDYDHDPWGDEYDLLEQEFDK